MEDMIEKAMKAYFEKPINTSKKEPNLDIAKPNDKSYTYKKDDTNIRDIKDNLFTSRYHHAALMADGNIDGIEQLCNILKKLLNAAWGTNWGEISPDLKKGEDSGKIILPQITAEINHREIASKMPLKPVLIDTVKETLDNNSTGDSILIYRQWFDCVVEFNIYGNTSKEARDFQFKFEALMSIYSGYIKRQGVSEILFLEEKSPRNSLNFTEQTPMRTLMYYVRFERITPVRQSLINTINANVGIKELNDSKVKQVIEANQSKVTSQEPQEIEFDFFNQDTGINYDDI